MQPAAADGKRKKATGEDMHGGTGRLGAALLCAVLVLTGCTGGPDGAVVDEPSPLPTVSEPAQVDRTHARSSPTSCWS